MALDNRDSKHPKNHEITVRSRRTVVIEGVRHVDNFDDDTIVLATELGLLTIRGRGLTIHQLDLEEGHFTAEGDIDALIYSRKRTGKPSDTTWKKLWR
jgi:sporulation protein YabP